VLRRSRRMQVVRSERQVQDASPVLLSDPSTNSLEPVSLRSVARPASQALSIVAIGSLLLLTYQRGKDLNFDQLNSHAALAFDFLNGHTYRDIPYGAGFGTGLPAFWAVPWWIAANRLPDWQTGLLLVGWAVPIVFAIRRITRVLFRSSKPNLMIEALALICALSSASFLTELGTTFGNLPSGMFVLLGVAILIDHLNEGPPKWRLGGLSAGLLFGIAVGLKWTNGVFVIASVVGLLIVPKGRPLLVRFVAASGSAAVFVSLPWMLPAWRNFGSPLYPWYNNIFRSEFFDPIPIRDGRWGLSSLDLFSFPWTLANGTTQTGEVLAADSRILLLAFGLILSTVLVIIRARGQEPRSPIIRKALADQPLVFLTCVVAISYIVWGSMFGVQRYFLVGEILAGLVALRLWSTVLGFNSSDKLTTIRLLIVPLLLVASVDIPNFGHVPWTGKAWYQVDAVGLNQSSIDAVLFENNRIAYLSFIFRPDAERIGLAAVENPGYRLEKRVRARIATASNPIAVFLSEKSVMNKSLARLDLRLATSCGTIGTGIEVVQWCFVERTS
jgi:hypothetical protein